MIVLKDVLSWLTDYQKNPFNLGPSALHNRFHNSDVKQFIIDDGKKLMHKYQIEEPIIEVAATEMIRPYGVTKINLQFVRRSGFIVSVDTQEQISADISKTYNDFIEVTFPTVP
jgi:hypothetical protein